MAFGRQETVLSSRLFRTLPSWVASTLAYFQSFYDCDALPDEICRREFCAPAVPFHMALANWATPQRSSRISSERICTYVRFHLRSEETYGHVYVYSRFDERWGVAIPQALTSSNRQPSFHSSRVERDKSPHYFFIIKEYGLKWWVLLQNLTWPAWIDQPRRKRKVSRDTCQKTACKILWPPKANLVSKGLLKLQ